MQTAEQITTANCRIYVAILADYNNGIHNGAWIDCDGLSAHDLEQEVCKLMLRSKHPNVQSAVCQSCGTVHLSQTVADIAESCGECGSEDVVNRPSAEEWAIHDSEGLPNINEWTPLAEIADTVEALESCDDPDALAAYADHMGGSVTDCLDDFQDAYRGEWSSEQGFAENLADDIGLLGDANETLQRYFDWEAWTRDLFMDGYTSIDAGNGNVYVFDDNV